MQLPCLPDEVTSGLSGWILRLEEDPCYWSCETQYERDLLIHQDVGEVIDEHLGGIRCALIRARLMTRLRFHLIRLGEYEQLRFL